MPEIFVNHLLFVTAFARDNPRFSERALKASERWKLAVALGDYGEEWLFVARCEFFFIAVNDRAGVLVPMKSKAIPKDTSIVRGGVDGVRLINEAGVVFQAVKSVREANRNVNHVTVGCG